MTIFDYLLFGCFIGSVIGYTGIIYQLFSENKLFHAAVVFLLSPPIYITVGYIFYKIMTLF